MDDIEKNTTETDASNTGNRGVAQERSATSSTEEKRLTLKNGIWFVAGLIVTLLSFRLVLKLLGANTESGFVDFIYAITSIFAAPFTNIFSTPTAEGDVTRSVLETGSIIAIIVYLLVAWGLVKLVNINRR